MAKSRSKSDASPKRKALKRDALVGAVRAAAQDSIAALHAAAPDREALHREEWGQAEIDTLGDIDELADALHGYASWVLSLKPHPKPQAARQRLTELRRDIFNLRALCGGKRKQLQKYLGRLEDLRLALVDFFDHIPRVSRSRVVTSR